MNTEAGTISGGGYNCRYSLSEDKESATIRFPSGFTWKERKNGGSSSISGSGTNDFSLMKTAGDMAGIVLDLTDSGPSWRGLLVSVLAFGMGLGMILRPYAFWKLKWGWRFRDAEPSAWALRSYRLSGSVLLLVSVILFFISLAI